MCSATRSWPPYSAATTRSTRSRPRTVSDAPTLTDLAAHYVKEILSVEPDGPWLLGGWSMGGVIAIEMSRLLAAPAGRWTWSSRWTCSNRRAQRLAGRSATTTCSIGSLATWPVVGRDWTPRPVAYSGENGEDAAEPAAHPDRVQSLRQSLVTADVLPSDIGVKAFQRIVDRFMTNSRLLEAHRPAPSGVRTLLLRAAGGGADEKTAAAWVELLGGEDTSVEAVPGNHYSVVAPPAVEIVADTIRRALNP